MDSRVAQLVERAQKQIAEQAVPNRFLDLLEAGEMPAGRLRCLAGELNRLVRSDQRSFALLASRFPAPPAGDLFLTMAAGEAQALRLLADFAAALGMGEHELRDHEPEPLAQAYPAYIAQTAMYGPSSAVPLALLVNVAESGGNYARVAGALRSHHGLDERAVDHFLFFAETPQELLDQAAAAVAAGLAAGEDPDEAVRVARLVSAYETVFWNCLA